MEIRVSPRPDAPDAFVVSGTSTEMIGDVAAEAGLTLHELSITQGSLEQAFMQLTSGDVQYSSAGGPRQQPGPPPPGFVPAGAHQGGPWNQEVQR